MFPWYTYLYLLLSLQSPMLFSIFFDFCFEVYMSTISYWVRLSSAILQLDEILKKKKEMFPVRTHVRILSISASVFFCWIMPLMPPTSSVQMSQIEVELPCTTACRLISRIALRHRIDLVFFLFHVEFLSPYPVLWSKRNLRSGKYIS